MFEKSYVRKIIRLSIEKIEPLGEGAIVASMLRDSTIVGNEGFNSGVDLVIQVDDKWTLEHTLSDFVFDKNRFCTNRKNIVKWLIDLWLYMSIPTGIMWKEKDLVTFVLQHFLIRMVLFTK